MEVNRFSFGALVATATLIAIAPAAPRAYGAESRRTSQSRTQTVVAGEQYEHAPGGTMMLGADYRDLWSTPIEVEVLDLQTAGGGLSPVTRVGGNETLGLAMKGQDGLSYTFRAVDKDLSGIVPGEFRGTPIELMVSDQIAGNFPGVQVVAGPLSEAAGVLHVDIQLVPEVTPLAGSRVRISVPRRNSLAMSTAPPRVRTMASALASPMAIATSPCFRTSRERAFPAFRGAIPRPASLNVISTTSPEVLSSRRGARRPRRPRRRKPRPVDSAGSGGGVKPFQTPSMM